jgi:hypothetical protein
MRYFTAFVVSVCMICLPLKAMAGFWGFEKKFSDRKNVSYAEITQVIYSYVDKTAERENSAVPADFKQVFQAVFEPTAVKMPFKYSKVKGSSRQLIEAGTIYFAKGKIFVKHSSTTANQSPVSDFATINGQLYAWKPGDKEGKILRRFTGDTIELVDYLIDPLLLMRYTYFDYYRSPKSFVVTKDKNVTTILRKKNQYGFAGIKFGESPLWLGANIFSSGCNKNICPPVNADTEVVEFEIDRPISIPQVPAELLQLPKNVKFIKSEESVDKFLSYL